MRRFVIAVFVLTALFQVPFALAVAWVLRKNELHIAWTIAGFLAALTLVLLPGRLARIRKDEPVSSLRAWFFEEPYFIHWCGSLGASVLFVVGALAVQIGHALGLVAHVDLGLVAALVYGVGLALASFGVIVRRRWVRVRTVEVTVPGLGAAFDGYRIVQLSDLHIGSNCPRSRAERWIAKANALDADLVALTGDYVTSGVAFHTTIAGVLAGLRAKDGVFAVMGNHDYFGDGEPLITLLCAGGVTMLRNERVTIRRGADAIELGGVDDTWTQRADVDQMLDGYAGDAPLVVLAHDPALFPKLAERQAALVLSGHTHWGQIGVPFLAQRYNLSRLATAYHAGLYHEGDATLYVHPGLGTTGPPVRFGTVPELTVLELRSASRSAA
jgi:predicted MPP superfamily phosphohydrolase